MRKKLLSTILALSMTAACLAGCTASSPMAGADGQSVETNTAISAETKAAGQSDSAAAAKPITIQFWNAFTGSDGDILREIVDRFNTENTEGIKIEMDIMPGATLAEKLAPALTTGTAPALLLQGDMDVALYAGNGSIQPLDDFFEVTGTDQGDFMPAVLEGFQYEGSQYMIPMQWFTQYLYYNKDLFDAAGITEVPTTWEGVAKAASKITDPSKNVYGLGVAIGGAVPWFDSLFLSNGGSIYDLDTMKSTVNSNENKASLQFIQDMVKAGYATKGTTGADLDNIMMANQLGMVINGPWMVAGLKESEINFGVAAMPSGSKGQIAVSESTGFSIPKGTPEDAKAAAYKFIAYWNTTEIGKEWSLRNGFPPYLNSVAADSEIQSNELVKVFATIKDYGQAFGTGLTSAATINTEALFPCIENVVAGGDVTEELQKASGKIDELLAAEK